MSGERTPMDILNALAGFAAPSDQEIAALQQAVQRWAETAAAPITASQISALIADAARISASVQQQMHDRALAKSRFHDSHRSSTDTTNSNP